jgi:hypothetical protein
MFMSTIEKYRAHAEDCLRQASTDRERDKPLWLTLAQSWLQLAEHADRINNGIKVVESEPERELEDADGPDA